MCLEPASQKSRSLEDKFDRFFSEFANLSQRIQSLEQKDSETVSSRTSSGRDSVHVARQPVVKSKPQLSSSASAGSSGRLERRSAMVTRAEFEQQCSSGQFSDESGGLSSSRKRSYSQSSEEPDPDLEQGEIRSKEENSPAYSETLETTKKIHIKPFQWFLKSNWQFPQSLDKIVPISQLIKEHLAGWMDPQNVLKGSNLHQKEHNMLMFTDASEKGWGGPLE